MTVGKEIQAAKLAESDSVEQEQHCVNGAMLLLLHWGTVTLLCGRLGMQERTKTVGSASVFKKKGCTGISGI